MVHPHSLRAFGGLLLGFLAVAPGMAQCSSGASVLQWRCWEKQIASNADFYNGGAGNPYRDLVLRVTFTNSGTGGAFTQDAFWLADTTNATTAKNFKVRVALPVGTWNWQVAGCTGTTGGQNCAAGGVTWTPSSGTFTVTSSPASPQIYLRGFPIQLAATTPEGIVTHSHLLYGDLTPFLWSGDTAWSAPGFEASNQTNLWASYISNRSNKFNVVLIAPAATYQPWPWPAGSKPFVPDCSTPPAIPNDCSRPNPAYWNKFDTLISNANQVNIIPLIAGLIDPLDTATTGKYPRQAHAVAFSRFMAARMAGFAVFFSPGFDDRTDATTSEGTLLPAVMDAVGLALKQAAPKHRVTNHLGGKSKCSDYETFRNKSWMNFFLFQSGHGIGLPTNQPDGGAGCPFALNSTETSAPAALRRSWQMPWTLTTSTATPRKPSYNGEGPYDNICLQTSGCVCPPNPPGWCRNFDPSHGANFGAGYVDIRYHNRQAAFESLLSGAYGYTYGSQELGHWYFNLIPFSSALNGPSVPDMVSVFQNFNTLAGMTPHRDWITNNGPDTANDGDKKKALASDGSSIVLAYLPAGTTNTINISTANLPGLACSGTGWTYTWRHAQNNVQVPGSFGCSGTNPIQVTKPPIANCPAPTYDSQACDWVLQIQKTGAASGQQSASGKTVDVWADLSPQDGTSAIYANLSEGAAEERNEPVLVSPPGLGFQQSPRVSRVPDGYLVVWHADGMDGSLLGIFGQLIDQKGQPINKRLQINSTAERDQRDPAIDSDPLGNTAVVWSSYDQDGDLGGIFGRVLDSVGRTLTPEFQINMVTAGHQEAPQVAYLPGGGFVVAWSSRPIDEEPGVISFRVFSRGGTDVTSEIRIPGQAGVTSRLVDAAATPTGGLRIRWSLEGFDGARLGLFAQEFNTSGAAIGPVNSLP